MTFKFKVETANTTQDDYEESPQKEDKPFERDNSDNKLFTNIQVKDISKYIDENTVGIADSDMLIYQACANMETKFIKVKDKFTGEEVELSNITTFKGAGKNIKPSSWLGLKNVDREIQGLPPLTPDDFEVTNHQKLKFDEDKSIEQAKIQILLKLKQVRLQFGIPKIQMMIGQGDNFRNKLPLCRAYKGNRTESARPLILKQVREWAVKEMEAILATTRSDGENIECDDLCEVYAAEGYKNYRKTGVFSYICISSDKDSFGNPKLLINPDTHSGKDNPLKGKFKFPQAMLIEATDRSIGDLELVAKASGSEVKGYGLKFIMYQCALGQDGADNYNALSHLDKGLSFGDQSAYKVLKPCKTAQETIQAAVDVFAELLPKGVQYITHDGKELDVDCMTYMDTYFKVAYMLRSLADTMDFYKLCKAFNVDTSKIVGNNCRKILPPKQHEIEVTNYTSIQEQVIALLSDKSGKVADKAARLEEALTLLNDNKHFEKLYEES